MAPIALTALQAAFLVLLYLFVWRAVRAIVRDVRAAPGATANAGRARQRPSARKPGGDSRGASGRGERSRDRPAPSELVVHVADGRPRVLRLDGTEVTFGRGAQSTVALSDAYASERHARIYREGGEWLVSDLGSTNGTFLNHARVTRPTPIAAGDQLAVGKTTVELRK